MYYMDHDSFYLFGMLEIFGNLFWIFARRLEIYAEMMFYIFQCPKIYKHWFLGILQKRRAPKFHAEPTGQWAEISHMRPIQARKLKLFQTPISR